MCLIILRPSPPFGSCNIDKEDYLLYLDNATGIEDSFRFSLFLQYVRYWNLSASVSTVIDMKTYII